MRNERHRSIVAPSELSTLALSEGDRVSIGGRVVAASGNEVTVADALWATTVRLRRAMSPVAGTLVVLDALYREGADGAQYIDAEVLSENGGVHTTAPGEEELHSLVLRTTLGEFERASRIGPNLVARGHAEVLIREFFAARNFLEVTTPTRVAAPGTDVYIEPQPSADHWLITSPEFHMKRLLVGGFPKIFQLARCHRQGELGAWHQPEFSLLEWYRAFAGQDEVLSDTEELVRQLSRALSQLGYAGTDPMSIDTRPLKAQSLLVSQVPDRIRLDLPFQRVSVSDAFRRFADGADACELAEKNEDKYFQLMVDWVEPALAAFDQPVFLTDYPISQAALARPCPGAPQTAERFELFIAGVELCNGYGELTDASAQRRRFEQDQMMRQRRGQPQLPLDEAFLEALTQGLPPSGGNALGVERLLALLLQVPLQDVIPFAEDYLDG